MSADDQTMIKSQKDDGNIESSNPELECLVEPAEIITKKGEKRGKKFSSYFVVN